MTRRYDFEVLDRLITARLLGRQVPGDGTELGVVTAHAVAVELGEDSNTIARARRLGVLRDVAERMATAAGYHPIELWPEIIDHDLEDEEAGKVECAASDCVERFLPRTRSHVFHVDACRGRQKRRRLGQAADRSGRTCSADGCHNLYLPPLSQTGPVPVYCSKTCRVREAMRAYRKTEAGKRSNRHQTQKYKAEVKELVARRAEQAQRRDEAA